MEQIGSINLDYLGITADKVIDVDASQAEVVSRQLMSRVKDIMMTIKPDGVYFNCTCIRAMLGVSFIHMLIDEDTHHFYVKPAEEYDKDSFRWCCIRHERRESRKITGREFGQRIYRLMGWSKGYYYQIGGTPAKQIGTDDEFLLVFELDAFDRYLMTEKGLKAAGVFDEDLGAEAEQIHFDIALVAEEKAEAKARAAEGKKQRKPSTRKTYQKNLQQGGFGVPLKDHVDRIPVPPLEQLEMITASGRV